MKPGYLIRDKYNSIGIILEVKKIKNNKVYKVYWLTDKTKIQFNEEKVIFLDEWETLGE
jgi:hypothetical protein